MNIISRIFSFLSGKKDPFPSTSNDPDSGVFCRESRVDQMVLNDINSSTLTGNCDKEHEGKGSSTRITRTLDRWNPETCVRLLRMPSVQNYSGLCKLISESDRNWMIQFLDMGGLQVLFESVDRLSATNSHSSKLERTLLLLQCVKCLKAVVNSQTALQHIIQQRTYVKTIAEVLSSANPLVKKQLFDFLSTLCIFSEGGHYMTLDVFQSFRVTHKERYRFLILLVEMKQAEVMPYVGAVLGLINCIILGASAFRFRTRLRNEFLALGVQDLLESLKQIPDEEVQLQCSVFLKSQLADEEYARSMGIHSSFSYFALFQALLDKIEDTPLSASFLVLLQNLNQLDPTDRKTDYVWSMLEEITESAVSGALRRWMLKECRGSSLKSSATQTCVCDEDDERDSIKSFTSLDSGVPVSRNHSFASHCPRPHESDFFPHAQSLERISNIAKEREKNDTDFDKHTNHSNKETQTSPLPPRSELRIPQNNVLVEEGKAKKTFSLSFWNRSKKYSLLKCPATATSLETQHSGEMRSGMTSIDVKRSRNQTRNSGATLQDCSSVDRSTLKPSSLQNRQSSTGEDGKEQTILPPPPPPPPPQMTLVSEILPGSHLRASWSGSPTAKEFEKVERRQHNTLPMPKSKMRTLNWSKIPAAHVSVHSIWSEINRESQLMEVNFEEMEKLFCQSEPRRKEPKIRQRKRATSEIYLLDNKRSLSIAVFLKQFKGGLEEVIDFVKQLKHKEIGAERLRTLLNLLPDSNEVKLLNSYTGDVKRLGTAERFLVRLSAIDHYDCLVEGMLLLEEFPTTLQILHDSVQSLLDACQELLTNTGFKNFLKLVLVTGNFMNAGSYAGNAAGFRLSTLPKLLETRANQPEITLLHYLVEETQRKCPDGVKFANDLLRKVNRCSRLSLESLSAEITHLDKAMHKLILQMEPQNGKLEKYFSTFTENGIKHLTILKKKMKEITAISVQLANRFCEDEQFQLEEFLNGVATFCTKIQKADSENGARKKANERKT